MSNIYVNGNSGNERGLVSGNDPQHHRQMRDLDSRVIRQMEEEKRNNVKVLIGELDAIKESIDAMQNKFDSLKLDVDNIDKKQDNYQMRMEEKMETFQQQVVSALSAISAKVERSDASAEEFKEQVLQYTKSSSLQLAEIMHKEC